MNDIINKQTHENLAETLAREMKQPITIIEHAGKLASYVALPPDWQMKAIDDERLLNAPRRKRAQVRLHDSESFVDYVKRHGSLANCTVWCSADYVAGNVRFTAILNDHGEKEEESAWRDHTASFDPRFSEEWRRWTGHNKRPFNQVEFATFIEDNSKDIAGVEGLPTGAQMLEMALNMEATQDVRFKSSIRLQSGGVQLNFVQDDDAQTLAKMQLFERFAIGLPVFWSGGAYRVDVRLRYRVRDGKVSFWYELVRTDKVLEDAAQTLVKTIRDQTGVPFFFGEPGLSG